jgi:hypothetical protein
MSKSIVFTKTPDFCLAGDGRCNEDLGHEGPHHDENGFEWPKPETCTLQAINASGECTDIGCAFHRPWVAGTHKVLLNTEPYAGESCIYIDGKIYIDEASQIDFSILEDILNACEVDVATGAHPMTGESYDTYDGREWDSYWPEKEKDLAPEFKVDWDNMDNVITAELLELKFAWSKETFGPGNRTIGVIDHIRKELQEIEDDPKGTEWTDVIILALDGFWRAGYTAQEIIDHIIAKYEVNEGRKWPDWRLSTEGKAIEHIRDEKTIN